MYNTNFFNAKPQITTQSAAPVSEFRPNPKKGQNGVFKAIVRFIPNLEDPDNKSLLMKYCAYLKDPKTQQVRTIDCPSTICQPDPIANFFFAYRNSENPILKENAQMFSRKQTFASYVQVITCESDPSLVNKILIWRFGSKINEKLNNEQTPEMGEGHYPFNLTSGRPFSVVVKEVGGFPNYDSCSFIDAPIEQSGMRILANGQWVTVTPQLVANEQGQKVVLDYIKNNIPDISKYEYHDWTDEDRAFVNECINVYSNPQASMAAYSAAQNPGASMINQQPMQAQAMAQPTATGFTPTQNNNMFGGAPTSQPNVNMFGGVPTPTAMPQMGQVPQMGVDVNSVNPTDNRGFNTSALPSDIGALIGGQQTPTTAPSEMSTQTIGMGLQDILGSQML